MNFTETTDKGHVNSQQIKEGTGRDSVMAKVRHCIMMGRIVHVLLRCCHSLIEVLRMDAFCGAVGLLVPSLRHEQVMKKLHDTHPGITLMKALARSLVW